MRQGFNDEHSLDRDDLRYISSVFDDLRISDESVFYTYSRLFPRRNAMCRGISRSLRKLDEILLPRIPALKSRYSLACLELSKR